MSYQVHESFIRRLHELDPFLGAFFNTTANLVIITYKRATGEPVPIMQVTADDGGFRIPDERDIIALKKSDSANTTVKQRLDRSSKYMADERAKSKAKFHADVDGRTADDKYQLSRAYAQTHGASGKVGRHVRRMAPKVTGKVF